MDTMIEVDPKLFVTCRLCLEDMGHYQIVPIVQQQIKYCFDIDVAPFDGLPQLICVKCKEILTNYYGIKKSLCEKQTNLRNKISKKEINAICLQPQQDTVSSSQPTSEVINTAQDTTTNTARKSKTRIKRTIDSSDSEDSCDVITSKKKSKLVRSPPKWDWTGYKKLCICKLCQSEWPTSKSPKTHHCANHNKIRRAFPFVFKNNCSVVLNKIDNKPNITSMNNIVVHNLDKLIEHCNTSYYIKYIKETNIKSSEIKVVDNKHKKRLVEPESTDTEHDINVRPKRRKRQVLSRSSNDTVVIETNGNKIEEFNDEDTKKEIQNSTNELTEQNLAIINNDNISSDIINDQCISIADSDSDEDTYPTESTKKQPLEATLNDFKIIHGIITMCVNAYHRKHESIEKPGKQVVGSESQLNHKVLSIGRKIINRQGFNWNGLLRYMEHKNLDILWATKALPNSKESNFIRIMTRLRDTVTADVGWVPSSSPVPEPLVTADTPSNISRSTPTLPQNTPSIISRSTPTLPQNTPSSISRSTPTLPQNLNNVELEHTSPPTPEPPVIANISPSLSRSMPTLTQHLNNTQHTQPPMDAAILLICHPPDPKSKLLNANPVANPKQLPRKLGQPSEIRLIKPIAEPSLTFQNNEENDSSMPIITSTTSLAVSSASETQHNNSSPVTTSDTEAPAPRIKVKPVTELMSERILNSLRNEQRSQPPANMLLNQSENQAVWPPQNVSNMFVSNMMPQLKVGSQSIHLVPLTYQMSPTTVTSGPPGTSAPNSLNSSKEEYVLLNTVELPNTKSNSPFKYLQTLLQMHDIILLEPQDTLPREFVCLIKFKVQFKQEPIDEPVVLCLSLFCNKNQFCFTVRDRHQKPINIDKVSPNWQWEILNVFRGDLVDKLLQNSQKHSQEAHDSTNKFLCLLKSVCITKLQ